MYNSPICPNSNQTIISFLFWYFVVICFRTFAFSNTVNMNLCGLPSLQSVKGCVTLVNKNILFYEIEQRYRVYPQIIGSQPVKLPAKGSTLIIDNTEGLIFRDDTIITCSETSIEPSAAFSVIVDENDIYLKALRSKSLGAKDFIVLDKVYRIMKSRFQIDDLIAAKGLISVLKSSIELPASEASATQMLVPNVLKTPVDLNYINESSNLYKGFMDQYLFCPYHSLVNGSVVEVLMGHFTDLRTWDWWDKNRLTPLGSHEELPMGALVMGQVHIDAIFEITATRVCASCKQLLLAIICEYCEGEKVEVDIILCVQAQDNNSRFKIQVKDIKFLHHLLKSCDPKTLTDLETALLQRGFHFDIKKTTEQSLAVLTDFDRELNVYIRTQFNFKLYPEVNVLCKKIGYNNYRIFHCLKFHL
ncbi:uncharacterized protein LOC132708694 isoform X3 [Cylas formicarius]|uniref:uncharacterized protein LOC132708694 isoform X3 n=1 Tax=Cylas formicarius TaxID=197179 RepID=UPI002958D30F|nr:uncharacterized protein LOC132708694 isoform X3 [Cylas formicarius]